MASSWLKTFLEPLNNDWKPTRSTRTANRGYRYFTGKQLVCKVSSSLGEDHYDTLEDKSNAVSQAKESLIDVLYIPKRCRPEDRFNKLVRRWKRYEQALNIKSDREKSGSMWTIEMLEDYINPEDIAIGQPESRFDLTGEALQVCERVDLAIKAVFGREGTVEKLNELHCQRNSTEFDARMILDSILQTLCVYDGLTLRSEQTTKSDDLPNNRYDYIIYCNRGHPIGVVEAKRCLKDESVVQLLLQLLLLSFEKPSWFYFGVLSDAYRLYSLVHPRKSSRSSKQIILSWK